MGIAGQGSEIQTYPRYMVKVSPYLIWWHGFIEIVALYQVAPIFFQIHKLIPCFNTLRQRFDSKVFGQLDDAFND